MLYLPNYALTQSIAIAQTQPSCPLTKSIYKAIAKPSFEMRFAPIKINLPVDAAVTLKHKIRGNIASYYLSSSMGYGSLNLAPVTSISKENSEESENKGFELKPVFFDRNWKNVDGIPKLAPQYLFVGGLGVEDWYSNQQKGSRSQVLGEVMWKFAGCQ
jgi:hypothetical protein